MLSWEALRPETTIIRLGWKWNKQGVEEKGTALSLTTTSGTGIFISIKQKLQMRCRERMN